MKNHLISKPYFWDAFSLRAHAIIHLTKIAAVVFGLALTLATGIAAVKTGDTFIYNGHSYFLLTPDTWTASEAAAVSLGGHLVTINDTAENDFVFNTFSQPGQYALWIGLNDAANEGTFVWSGGQPVTFTDWHSSQPDNSFDPTLELYENYVMIFVEEGGLPSSRAGKWNDSVNMALENYTSGGVKQGVVEVESACTLPTLAYEIQGSSVEPGLRKALVAKLTAAINDIDAKENPSACGVLGSFLNQCAAQSGKKLTTDQATAWIACATSIRSQLGCD